MLSLLFVRGRHGPLLQVGVGAAFVAAGLVASAWFALGTGGVLLVCGIATGISRLTGHNDKSQVGSGQRSHGHFALRR